MHAGHARLATAAGVAVLLALRLLQKTTEYQFIVLVGWEGQQRGNATAGVAGLASVTSWMYTCRYLLPVLGGLLACGLGHARVLRLGGAAAMLACTAALTVAVSLDSLPGAASATLGLVGCLLMLIVNGLVIPSVMHGVLDKRTQPTHRTALCALIYISSSAGLGLGVGVSKLWDDRRRHPLYAVACLTLSVVYTAIALLVLPRTEAAAATVVAAPADETAVLGRRIHLPTRSRLKRSCLVFCAVIPYLVGVCDDRATVFKAEFVLLTNSSSGAAGGADGGSGARDTLTAVLLAAGLVAANTALATAACVTRRRLPVRPRLLGGLAAQAVHELALALLSGGVFGLKDPVVVGVVYSAASAVDALTAVLVMVAAYELMDGFERDAARPLIVGVMLTVWGLANVASRLLLVACFGDRGAGAGRVPAFAYHGILMGLLVAGLLYCLYCALPLARTLTVTYDPPADAWPLDQAMGGPAEDGQDNDETRPLMRRIDRI